MHIGLDVREIARPDTGIGNYAVNLVQALAAFDQENQYTLFVEEQSNTLNLPKNFRVVCLKRAPIDKIQDQWILPRTASTHGLDLLHCTHHDVTPLLTNLPCVLTVHDIAPMDFPGFSSLHRLYYRTLTRYAVRRARRIMCDSQSTCSRIEHYFPGVSKKATVVHLGRDESFRPDPQAEEFLSLAAPLGIRSPYILYVGSLMERKNITNLVMAVRRLQQLRPDIQMVFFGGKPSKDDPRFAELHTPQVIFAGHMEGKAALRALYSQAELLLFPSLYEGFGLPLLEAMACGCPTVTSHLSSLPELVGDAGVLVNPYDPDAIVNGAMQILESSAFRTTLVERGLRQVQTFSWKKAGRQALAVYEQSLNKNRLSRTNSK